MKASLVRLGTLMSINESTVRSALSRVVDPEIGKPITELGMVKSIDITGNDVAVSVYLTVAGCPMRNTIETNTQAALEEIEGVGNVTVFGAGQYSMRV